MNCRERTGVRYPEGPLASAISLPVASSPPEHKLPEFLDMNVRRVFRRPTIVLNGGSWVGPVGVKRPSG
jgi:hypothetical protein